MDTKQGGFLLEQNFEHLLQTFLEDKKELVIEKANFFFNLCDKDHSGVVSIQEFLNWSNEPSFDEFLTLIKQHRLLSANVILSSPANNFKILEK